MRYAKWAAVVTGGVLCATSAFAQDRARDSRSRDSRPYVPSSARTDLRVQAGGGIHTLGGDLADVAGIGPAWGVTVGSGGSRMIDAEVGYSGSRLPLTDSRFESGESLWRHGGSALLKVSPLELGAFHPFVGAGVGVSHIRPTDGAKSLYRSDFVTEVPLAAGVDVDAGRVTAGLRGTMTPMFGEEFADDAGRAGQDATLMGATLTVGGKF